MMRKKVLVIDDEKSIRDIIGEYLTEEGFEFVEAPDGIRGLEIFRSVSPDLVILDVMMPKMDGWKVCREIRSESVTPVIMLTARGEEYDKLFGFELGADDYMVKPFSPRELIARVNSNLRRYEQILNLKGSTQTPSNQLIVGGLVLDQATKEVFVNGQSVRLTKKEFQILELLMSYPGKVYSAEEIYESIWEETAINTETIMVHVRRLREKIEANPKHPEYLKAVWGVGYKIEKME